MEEMNFNFPKMETKVEGDEVIVKVFVSGFDKKDFELEVQENSLKVEVGKKFEKEDKGEDFFGKEWKSSSFQGEVSLPCKVVPMIPKYSYDGSILEVRMKKD